MTKKQKKILDNDEIMVSLKERYFRLALKERIGIDDKMTKMIDCLEVAIRARHKELLAPKPEEPAKVDEQ